MSKIADALNRLLDKHRIVVWYDEDGLLASEGDVELAGASLLKVEGNEYALKYRVLKEEPGSKFVLYSTSPRPDDLGNWLLDIELAGAVFQADQVALWLSDLGLGPEFANVVRPHEAFFGSKKRTDDLRSVLSSEDTPDVIRLKMLAICAETESNIEHILERLFADVQADRSERISTIERCALNGFLWSQVERLFGYPAEDAGLQDLAINLFIDSFARDLGQASQLSGDAALFMGRWKDSARYGKDYESFAADFQDQLDIESKIQAASLQKLAPADTFEIIDLKILSELARSISGHMIKSTEVERLVQQRRQTHWWSRHAVKYSALLAASRFFDFLAKLEIKIQSTSQGIERYAASWYRVDQLYRDFHQAADESGQATLFDALSKEVDQRYTAQFLVPLSEAWQEHVDAASTWIGAGPDGLAAHLRSAIDDHIERGVTLVVLISDALRFEVGEELSRAVMSEDKYEVSLSASVSPLPSFTQLGMASMLPHKEISLSANGDVLVDGMKTVGTAAREKVLAEGVKGKVKALQVSEFVDFKKEDSRALIRDHDVIFLYHNLIDAIGDKRDTEERVFTECQRAIDELVRAIKKLFSANASNVIVTSDHGFQYQDHAVEDLDFVLDAPEDDVGVLSRRFVIGKNLKESGYMKRLTSKQLGLGGDAEVLIPKGIYRLRQKGSGSRYVHGGASLQEVVVPMLHVTKKRESDVEPVAVEILAGGTSSITTGQLSVSLYQVRPISEKRPSRSLRIGIYAGDGSLISDQQQLTFSNPSDQEREREVKVTLILKSDSSRYNGQQVELRLEEPIAQTSQWRTYQKRSYTLQRSFTSDFDF